LVLNSLVFLYARVLERPLGNIGETIRAKRPLYLPVAISHAEGMRTIASLQASYDLLSSLYEAGLRVMVWIKGIDFAAKVIAVRGAKGAKDRTTLLPNSLIDPLQQCIELIHTGR
jgi:hypothetical protein